MTEQVIYEMHIGTFTREGTWAAAALELPELAELGVTVIEIMPVAEFPGRFGWGYDGVDLFAPTRLYGSPDDLRPFVDGAHALGIARDPRRGLQPFRPRRQLSRHRFPRTISPTATRTNGARRSISTARTPVPSASFSSPTPATGSTSFTSTVCGSMPRNRSSMARPTTFWPRSSAGSAKRRAVAARCRRGKRTAGDEAGSPSGAGRLRPRCGCGTMISTTARSWP